jgi:hypothetical protein
MRAALFGLLIGCALGLSCTAITNFGDYKVTALGQACDGDSNCPAQYMCTLGMYCSVSCQGSGARCGDVGGECIDIGKTDAGASLEVCAPACRKASDCGDPTLHCCQDGQEVAEGSGDVGSCAFITSPICGG